MDAAAIEVRNSNVANVTHLRPTKCHTRETVNVPPLSFLQFIRGVSEQSIPEVRLTRGRDGASGTASFVFKEPTVFEASSNLGDITGLYMVDDEGVLQTVDVQAKFINGKPSAIEARYIMRSTMEWDRFMRFMERYAEDQGLGFQSS